jgi:hypothetical protein
VADGGGKAAAGKPIRGAELVARFLVGVARLGPARWTADTGPSTAAPAWSPATRRPPFAVLALEPAGAGSRRSGSSSTPTSCTGCPTRTARGDGGAATGQAWHRGAGKEEAVGLIGDRFDKNVFVTSLDFVFNWPGAPRSGGSSSAGLLRHRAHIGPDAALRYGRAIRFAVPTVAAPGRTDDRRRHGDEEMAPVVRTLYDQMPERSG